MIKKLWLTGEISLSMLVALVCLKKYVDINKLELLEYLDYENMDNKSVLYSMKLSIEIQRTSYQHEDHILFVITCQEFDNVYF